MRLYLFMFSVCFLMAVCAEAQTVTKNERRLQQWHDNPVSLFVHWGPVSLIGKEISWSRNGYGKARYDSLYRRFNPTRFNAREWVLMAKRNGFKQIVLTAKHHDGFCLWDTKTMSYNIMHSPFGRDICKELAQAAHEEGVAVGWYFSAGDWRDPDCRNPQTNAVFVDRMLTQIQELLTNYGKISLLWVDYDGWPSPAHPEKVYSLARRLQPDIIINNRLEPFTPDESHARVGPYSDYATPENFVAGYGKVPWETCTNMGHQWAWKFGDTPRPLPECVQTLLRCVGGNGNLLFNIGPDSTGAFPAAFVNRTNEMGEWINRYAGAIYKTKGGPYTPTRQYVATYRDHTVYLHVFPGSPAEMHLPALGAGIKKAELLNKLPVTVQQDRNGLHINLPESSRDSVATILALTLDKPAASLGTILPFTSSSAVSYGRKATASGSLGDFLHDATAAFDDNPDTAWKPGRRADVNFDSYYGRNIHYMDETVMQLFQHTGWLEVDLGKPQTINRLAVSELVYNKSVISDFTIEYQNAGKWIPVAWDTRMGNWTKEISPVRAQKFRLVINASAGYPGIREFQLFAEPSN